MEKKLEKSIYNDKILHSEYLGNPLLIIKRQNKKQNENKKKNYGKIFCD